MSKNRRKYLFLSRDVKEENKIVKYEQVRMEFLW